MDDAPRTPAAPGPLASFARFVALGGGVGLLSSGAVALLAEQVPWALANALITVVSTLLCTELHARFTFGSGRSAGWRQHWQSAGSAAAAYVVTCAAMLVLHLVQSSPGMLTEQFVYLGASGLAGLARFLLLRLYVFATGRDRATVPEQKSASGTVFSPVPVPVRTNAPRPARTSTAAHRAWELRRRDLAPAGAL
ncbi:GtrA family protein [Streptomyces sp. NPDC101776]|uniref:GtrA family protein n=1 Tax=Streptomyces sp. NPDC101776 TaxID=3366146 RepID=UPI0037F5A8D5